VLLFRVGPLRLGVEACHVREVTREIAVEIPSPKSTAFAGLLTLRGRTTAVLDMNALLDAPRDAAGRRGRLILLRPPIASERDGSGGANGSDAKSCPEPSPGADDGDADRTTSEDGRPSSVCLRVDAVERLWPVELVEADVQAASLLGGPIHAIARTPDGELLGIVDVHRLLRTGEWVAKEECGRGH